LVDESIPWLVANGKLEKANKIMKDALKYNGKPVPNGLVFKESDEFKKIDDSQKVHFIVHEEGSFGEKREEPFLFKRAKTEGSAVKAKEVGVADLFRSSNMRRYTLAGFYLQ